MKNDNSKKSKLIFYMIVAIIILFMAGIIYQFVCIKQLESRISNLESSVNINYEIDEIRLTNF